MSLEAFDDSFYNHALDRLSVERTVDLLNGTTIASAVLDELQIDEPGQSDRYDKELTLAWRDAGVYATRRSADITEMVENVFEGIAPSE